MNLHKGKKSSYYYPFYISLLAVLMLTFGPITSQTIAFVSSKTTSHARMADDTKHCSTENNTQQGQQSSMPMKHNMSLCGYCDLLHSPVLFSYTPIIPNAPSHFTYPLTFSIEPVLSSFYSSALSRAPPSLS